MAQLRIQGCDEETISSTRPRAWDLSGKVAIVTGAARGIGLATATLLRARGARVVATDLSDAVHAGASDEVATLVADVSRETDARATAALAVERFGRLDILVNNAGRTLNKPIVETGVEEFDAFRAVNARGSFLQAREAMKVMEDGGAIVPVASPSPRSWPSGRRPPTPRPRAPSRSRPA